MRFVLLVLFFSIVTLQPTRVVGAPISEGRRAILSFKQWKLKRIAEAQAVLAQMLREQGRSSARSPHLKKRIAQARLNVQFTRELSSHDYFVVYLAEQFPGNRHALEYAARTLTPAELSEILSRYQVALLKPTQEEAPSLARSLSDMGPVEHSGEGRIRVGGD